VELICAFYLLQTLARLAQLRPQNANFPLLLLGRFDQQGGKSGAIDAAGVCAAGFVADEFGRHHADFFSNHSDSCLPVFFRS
jgi:hypothetical protein